MKRVKWLEIVETTGAESLDDLIERVEALEKATRQLPPA
jgi:uncharacterized protein (UPF0335 family)